MRISETKRKRIFEIIQIGNEKDAPSRAFDIFIVVTIIANIAVLLLDTFDSLAAWNGLFRFYDTGPDPGGFAVHVQRGARGPAGCL